MKKLLAALIISGLFAMGCGTATTTKKPAPTPPKENGTKPHETEPKPDKEPKIDKPEKKPGDKPEKKPGDKPEKKPGDKPDEDK